MKKRIILSLLALMLTAVVWASSPTMAAASGLDQSVSAFCGENATWSLSDDGTLTISGTGDMFSYYGENTPWNSEAIKKVVVEEGITRVGGNAFMGCYNMTEVSLPNGLLRIGKEAFAYCSGLQEIDLPNTVNSIGARAFAGCGKLEEMDIPEGVTNIGYGTFQYCSGLETVSLPVSLERIGNYVFTDCTNLASVAIPENVTNVGDWSFAYCDSLAAVTIPDNVTYIGDYAFYGCTNLASLAIPDGVTYIGDHALYLKRVTVSVSDENVNYGDELTVSASAPYAETVKVYMVDPSGETSVLGQDNSDQASYSVTMNEYTGEYSFYAEAFFEYEWKTSAAVNATVIKDVSCGENATWSLSDDGTLTISGTGDMFSYYGEETPWNPEGVKKVIVEAGITRVGGNAFMNCYNLTEVSLPSGLLRIGKEAFAYCWNLPEIDLPNTVNSIGSLAFAGCEKLEEIVIPTGVTNVGYGSFQFCYGLKKATLPNSLERIGKYVFYYCTNLPSITIPGGVTYIGDYAFWGCEQLHAVRLPDNVSFIGNHAFDDSSLWGLFCSSTGQGPAWAQANGVNAFLLDKNILTLPAGTTDIESEAFADLGVNITVVIPSSIEQIAPDAFDRSTVAFRCAKESYAAAYAADHDIPIVPD